MRYLIDTKVFHWMMAETDRIEPRTTEILGKDGADLYLSATSAWEIAIKLRFERVHLPQRPLLYVPERMAAAQIRHLPVDERHTFAASQLDDHHTDPIDRLLVCQTKEGRMQLISSDPTLDTYGIDAPRYSHMSSSI